MERNVRQIDTAEATATPNLSGCRCLVLSPHLDDAVLSCGGALAVWAEAGERPAVATICAGRPTEPLTDFARFQHERWGQDVDLVGHRRGEDQAALAILGARPVWLDVPDCIYRGERYTTEGSIFGPVAADEATLVEHIADQVAALWSTTASATIYAPLAIGHHVDHQLTRAAAKQLQARGLPVAWYEDFPYVVRPGGGQQVFSETTNLRSELVRTGAANDLKIVAMAHYGSQVPVLFGTVAEMAISLQVHAQAVGEGLAAERFWYDRM